MMYKRTKYLALLFLALVLLACGKEGCKDPSAVNFDPSAKKDDGSCQYPQAMLSIGSPQEGQTFSLGDTVQILGTATHNASMHGWELFLVNTSTEPVDTVMTINEHDHGTTLNVSEKWINDVSMHSDMALTIQIDVDHSGTMLVEQVHFHCHPM